MKQVRAGIAALIVLVMLTWSLLISHARPIAPECFDQLLLRWNQFANDSNNHMQTNDVKRTNHEKAHDKLDREWQALQALTCW